MDNLQEAEKVLWIILALNWFVAFIKIFIGLVSGSLSVLADGTHAFFDGVSNILGLAGMKVAQRPPDAKYPYGYGKYVEISAYTILLFLIIAVWEFSKIIYQRFIGTFQPEVDFIIIGILAATIFIDYFVAKYERLKGKKLRNKFLIADSLHTKSHLFITLAVIFGMVFVKLGFPILDPIIASGILVWIIKLGFEVFKETAPVLADKAQIGAEDIEKALKGLKGVVSIHQIRTRGSEGFIFLDAHLGFDAGLSVGGAHRICGEARARIQERFPEVKDVIIHIEPFGENKECSCE